MTSASPQPAVPDAARAAEAADSVALDGDDLMRTVEALNAVLARQRQALEAGQFDLLAGLNTELEGCCADLNRFPAGADALRSAVDSWPEARQVALREVVRQLDQSKRINADLVRVNLARVATLQAFQLASSDAGTYGGLALPVTGTQLSRRA
jgi:hypothetical protein